MANWKFNGKNISPSDLRKLLLAEEEKKAADAAVFAAKELQKFIDKINNPSSMRGAQADELAGKHIVGSQFYNQPLKGAKVVISRRHEGKKTIFRIQVQHKTKRRNGEGINLFDLLDQGREDKTVDSEMIFPIYSGRRTVVAGRGNPRISSTPVKLEKPLRFYKRSFIQGFPGRNYYETVAARVRRKFYPLKNVNFMVGGKGVNV
jgi:hypothetical protein